MIKLISEDDINIGTEFYCVYDSRNVSYGDTVKLTSIKEDTSGILRLTFVKEKYPMGIKVHTTHTLGRSIPQLRGEDIFGMSNRHCQYVYKDLLTDEDLVYLALMGENQRYDEEEYD